MASNARSSRRRDQEEGHSAATVINPNGGVIAASGSIRSTPSNPQNEGGNFGQISRTLRFEPRGGKYSGVRSSDRIEKRAIPLFLLEAANRAGLVVVDFKYFVDPGHP